MTADPPPFNLTRLAHFVAVADAGNMTTAAADLRLTQQAVSHSIRQLERELTVEVFHRAGRRLTLTSAGHVLRAGAPTLLAAAHTLAQASTDAAADPPQAFVLAHSPALTSDEVFLLTTPIRKALPALPIRVHQAYPRDLTDGILDRRFDLGLRRGVVPPTQLAGAIISHTTLHAAVCADHPLAGRSTVSMADLAHHPLMAWAPPGASFYTDYLLSICRRAGFEPTLHINHIQGTTPATAVVDTPCFAFVTQHPGTTLAGHVTIIPIDDAPQAPVQAIWLPHTHSQPREALLAPTNP